MSGLKLRAPILPFLRSVAGRLQVVVGTMFLALAVANAQCLLSATTDHSRLGHWFGPLIAAGTTLLGVAVILMIQSVVARLNVLTKTAVTLAENCSGSATVSVCRGDEIDELSQALKVIRENSQRAQTGEANLKAAVENMVEGIVMISADGRVALHNQRLLTIFGLPPMNAIGLSRSEFNTMLLGALNWPQSARDYLQRQLSAVRKDAHYRVLDVELPNNRVLRYSASLLADGNVMSYVEDISEQRVAAASILRLAHYDMLTDLPNRTLFQERLAGMVKAAAPDPTASATLLLCDLDRFKAVNDTHGHPAGDELLRQAARRMRAQTRPDGVLARLGGDEFAIIYLGQGDLDGARHLANRLVACFGQPFEIQGHEISVGLSVGIATARGVAASGDELMKQADLALYSAKRGGRNMYKVYEPAMSMLVNDYVSLEAALRRAIENGGLHLHYQPQVDLRTRRIVGFEALARWDHPERGAVAPGVFIPLAEETGLVVPLGEWALRQACADALSWDDDITIAVNVAPQQLKIEGFADMVRDVLAGSGLKPERLELEITETAPLHDDKAMLAVLWELASIGVHLSMDDFGTGNTGLSYLQRFRFDKLKIDQSFVNKLGDWKEAELIVRAIVELSATLSVKTVAEGIETELQAAILSGMNCAVGQGYLFGRPAPASVANILVADQHIAPQQQLSGRFFAE